MDKICFEPNYFFVYIFYHRLFFKNQWFILVIKLG